MVNLEDKADMAWYDDARVQPKPSESLATGRSSSLLILLRRADHPCDDENVYPETSKLWPSRHR